MNQPVKTCAICGCTDERACFDELRGACWWVSERLCSHCAVPDPRRGVAMTAASQLASAVDELLIFSREGDQETFGPFALALDENVAQALMSILAIQSMPGGFANPPSSICDEGREALIAELERYLGQVAP